MFLGEYQHSLDSKGRLIIPAEYRAELGEEVVTTVGLDRCVTIYTPARWEQVVEDLENLPANLKSERGWGRMMLALAKQIRLDGQGRITMTPRQREYASLTGEVTVVGQNTKLEVWQTERWDTFRDGTLDDFANTNTPFSTVVRL